jgi:glutathione S-transferase
MSLKLYYHPLSSYCWKALIALYENETPFEPILVNLGEETSRAAFLKVWPLGKFPVLRDEARGSTVPESSIVIEYLDRHYPGKTKLVPADPDGARQMRLRDRFVDLYIHNQMQKIVGDRLRPADQKDPFGVAEARAQIAAAFDLMERDAHDRPWLMGDAFTMADCAALPALFYADKAVPIGARAKLAAYFERLKARPAAARVLKEAEPYMHLFPGV